MNLTISNLTKTYGNGRSAGAVRALNDVSFMMGAGLFGLLGPSGAGKSSLMRTIATLQEADNGSIVFDGPFIDPLNLLHRPQLRRQRKGGRIDGFQFTVFGNQVPRNTRARSLQPGFAVC